MRLANINIQRPLWPSLLSAAILTAPLATAQNTSAPFPAFSLFSDNSSALAPFGGFGIPRDSDIVPSVGTGLVCGDLPPCSPAGGSCATEADCCVPGQTCSAGTCTPPPCDTPDTADRDGCACTSDDECEGLRECTPGGPTAGTCQFFYSIVATWTADIDFDLAYRTTAGRQIVLFNEISPADLATRTPDDFSSCGSLSTEAFTFTSALGRDDIFAELDDFSGNTGRCRPSAALHAVAYGVEVAATSCQQCRTAGLVLSLDTPQGPLTCGGLEIPLPPPVADAAAPPGAAIPPDGDFDFPMAAPAPVDTSPGCGRADEPCCPGDVCDYSYQCDVVNGTCGFCGFNLEPCCSGDLCYQYAECSSDDFCSLPAYAPVPFAPFPDDQFPAAAPAPDDTPGCGMYNEPCCPGDACDYSYLCNPETGSCGFCGLGYEPCCPGDLCYQANSECSSSNMCRSSGFAPSPAPSPFTYGDDFLPSGPSSPPLPPPPGSAPSPADLPLKLKRR